MAAKLVGNGAAWSEATLQAIKAPANAHAKAVLKICTFSSVIWCQIPRNKVDLDAQPKVRLLGSIPAPLGLQDCRRQLIGRHTAPLCLDAPSPTMSPTTTWP
jgi:hypothetical protein